MTPEEINAVCMTMISERFDAIDKNLDFILSLIGARIRRMNPDLPPLMDKQKQIYNKIIKLRETTNDIGILFK